MDRTETARAVKGIIPPAGSGALSLEKWAEVLGKKPDTVRVLFWRNKVRRRKIGDTVYARPEDVWEAFPNEDSGE